MSRTWVVVNPDSSAQGTRLHFSRIELEDVYDVLLLKDSGGVVYERITGTHAGGLWSMRVGGAEVHVQLVTDESSVRWGFCVDEIETTTRPPVPTAAPSATPGGGGRPGVYWYPN